MAAVNNDILGGVTLVVSAVFFVPMFLRSRIATLPEFLEKRYSRTAKLLFGGMFIVQSVAFMPIGFYVGGLAVLGLLGLDPSYLPLVTLIIGVTAGTYAIVGGFTALVRTDVVQTVLLVGGGLIVTVATWRHVGGWTELRASVGDEPFRLLQPRGSDMPWTSLPGIAIHSIFFFIASVSILQRALGALSLDQARKGLLFAAYLKLLAIPLFALPGIMAASLYPDAVGDETYAFLMRDFVPVILAGVVLAGMVAALMSTGEAGINAASSVVALDFLPVLAPNASQRTAVAAGRICSATIIVFGIVAAPWVANLGPVYPFLLLFGAFSIVPVGVSMAAGRFWRRANAPAATATLVAGYLAGSLYVVLRTAPGAERFLPESLRGLHFYEVVPLFALFCAVIVVVVSLCTPPPPADSLVILADTPEESREAHRAPVAWWERFGVWALVYLIGVLGLYLIF